MSTSTIELSLDRIRKLAAKLPPYTRPTVHITGTNGKGSVSSIVGSILHSSGIKVGKFNSPHLINVRDSISIVQEPVSETVYTKSRGLVEEWNNGPEGIGASLFEVLTLTAMQVFEKEAVDVAVIEVGMGGRLDATNILPQEGVVKVSAMTSVDIDHVRWLGSSVEDIAKEKAGIARPGVPFVLGPQKWPNVEDVVGKNVAEAGAIMRRGAKVEEISEAIRSDYPTASNSTRPSRKVRYTPPNSQAFVLDFPFLGIHQLDNLSTALGIIESLQSDDTFKSRLTTHSIQQGVSAARWPGRLEYILCTPSNGKPFTILADGAHNSASSTALRHYLDTLTLSSSPSFILSLSHSPPKTPLETLEPLLNKGDNVAIVPFSPVEDMPWVSPSPTPSIREAAESLIGDGEIWSVEASAGPATLRSALEWASSQSDLVVVAGSLYLIADLYRLIYAHPEEFTIL